MGTRGTRVTRNAHRATGLALLGLSLAFSGITETASANAERLPAAYTSLVSYHEAERLDVATREAGKMLAAESRVGKRQAPLPARYRNIKLLSYSRAVEVGKEDVIVNVQSPGKRKSIMMVELKF